MSSTTVKVFSIFKSGFQLLTTTIYCLPLLYHLPESLAQLRPLRNIHHPRSLELLLLNPQSKVEPKYLTRTHRCPLL